MIPWRTAQNKEELCTVEKRQDVDSVLGKTVVLEAIN